MNGLKKYLHPLIILLVFEAVAVTLWLTKDNLFCLDVKELYSSFRMQVLFPAFMDTDIDVSPAAAENRIAADPEDHARIYMRELFKMESKLCMMILSAHFISGTACAGGKDIS